MKITIEQTDDIRRLDGVECRIWNGVTEAGIKCLVLVHRIAVLYDQDHSEFERALREEPPPRQVSR